MKWYEKKWILIVSGIFFPPLCLLCLFLNKKMSSLKRKILLGIVGIWSLIFAIGIFTDTNDAQVPKKEEKKEVEKKVEKPKEENKKEEPKIKAGMYKVGSDIEPGLYVLFSENKIGGYYERNTGSDDLDSIIENDNFNTFTYVQIKENEYFKLNNAYAVKESEVTKKLSENGIIEGMYKVGKDIEAGEYKIITESEGYWEKLDSNFETINNDNFTNNAYVKVKDGQYLKIVRAKAEKTK